MDGLPQRLREQRLLLRLTQEGFGSACGVRRKAQAAYEAGSRIPDAEYLILAGRLGADVKYLLTGVKSTEIERERLAVEWLLRALCRELEAPTEVGEMAIAKAVNLDSSPPDELGKAFAMQEIAAEMVRRSRRLNAAEVQRHLDRDLLCDAIREQEAAWFRSGKTPSPIEKSHRFATLYEDASQSGKLNENLVEGGVIKPLRRGKAA